jgi:NAD(P)-dependent dehydrogenase (short-subunit alcohol dehydrogenase family)
LKDRIALITGASRGIGRAIAKRFAELGAEVICVARTQGALEELDDEITANGGKAVLVPEDLTKPDSIEKIAQAIAQRYGKLDVLVGNAGILGGELTPVGHGGTQMLDKIFALNVTANWRLINAFDPLLRRSDAGRAIFVTDPIAHTSTPFWGGYASSKAALETLALTWAAEIGTITKIKVNLVAPCPVATRLRGQAFPGEDPNGLRKPEQIAEFFVPLAKSDCQVHGEIITIQ